jgi:NAD(P)-dependent dehydrogenase (short-subunit alcohol dehydrogenase family)
MSDRVIAVLGVGPGLGLSVARRFAASGCTVALASRTEARHDAYLAALPGPADGGHGDAPGSGHRGYAADLTDLDALTAVVGRITDDLGPIEIAYFGPAVAGSRGIVPLPSAGAADVREPLDNVLMPAVAAVSAVLPGMLERGSGTILLPGGLSGLRPMPVLGNLAPMSAALRMYALTLHDSLAGTGVHVGALTIGGLITGGDIHRMVTAGPGGDAYPTLDPDAIAEAAWRMAAERTPAEVVFEAG